MVSWTDLRAVYQMFSIPHVYFCDVTLFTLSLGLSSGVFPQKHPEEHGVHMSQREELHYQQGDEKPLSILSPAEVLYCGNVQRV